MNLTAKPFRHGLLRVISGPVASDKQARVEGFLDALVDSGHKRDGNILVFQHPEDDPNSGRIGKHNVPVTGSVDDIFESIQLHTETVIVVGASHYHDPSLVELADVVVRSNRQMVVSGLNLGTDGKPFGDMAGLMALADDVEIAKGICFYQGCSPGEEAVRSVLRGKEYAAACTHHAEFPNVPPIEADARGRLSIDTGSVFSAKSSSWGGRLSKAIAAGQKPIVLKYLHDVRYSQTAAGLFEEGNITLHSSETISGINVKTADDIREYLSRSPFQKRVFLSEGQFFPGLYNLVAELLPKGYRFDIDALARSFNRKPFNDIPAMMALADDVRVNYAVCVQCGKPGTDSQRMKIVDGKDIPADFKDPLEAVGGAKEEGVTFFYQARCLDDWVMVNEPSNRYTLPRFEWNQ